MRSEKLGQLVDLANARKAHDLALLEAALAEDRRLELEIATLTGTVARDMADPDMSTMPYSQYAIRLQWADHRISEAAARRKALQTEIRKLRSLAAAALGKHRALEKLTERARKQQTEIAEARRERETAELPRRDTDLT